MFRPFSDFTKSKSKANGLIGTCKRCEREKRNEYFTAERVARKKASNAAYRRSDRGRASAKAYHKRHREKIRAKRKLYNLKNPDLGKRYYRKHKHSMYGRARTIYHRLKKFYNLRFKVTDIEQYLISQGAYRFMKAWKESGYNKSLSPTLTARQGIDKPTTLRDFKVTLTSKNLAQAQFDSIKKSNRKKRPVIKIVEHMDLAA